MIFLYIGAVIVGIALCVASFFIPDKNVKTSWEEKLENKKLDELINTKIEKAKEELSRTIEEMSAETQAKTERSLERISNDKIMAVNEYSDTVLKDINKNHEEVVFLYDMLNEKQDSLKNTAVDAQKVLGEVNDAIGRASMATDSVNSAVKESEQEIAAIEEAKQKELAERAERLEKERLAAEQAEIARAQAIAMAAAAVQGSATEETDSKEGLDEADDNTAAESTDEFEDILSGLNIEPITDAEKVDDLSELGLEDLLGDDNDGKEPSYTVIPQVPAKAPSIAQKPVKRTVSRKAMEKVPSVSSSGGNNNDKILKLYKQGLSNVEIAKKLGLGVGEVKLVIDLYKQS
jgi:hypothetical protein